MNGPPIDYTLDINTGLTQVLSDGANAYLYGVSRIGEEQPGGWQYYLTDAIGSVRQLANEAPLVIMAESYGPFGNLIEHIGSTASTFGFDGEQTDGTSLVYLRARYLEPNQGRYLSRDPLLVEANGYSFAESNPATRMDPSGLFTRQQIARSFGVSGFDSVLNATQADINIRLPGSKRSDVPLSPFAGGR